MPLGGVAYGYTQGGTGVLAIDIDAASGQSDLLSVAGVLTLGGTLEVNLLGGALNGGEVFDILDWGSLQGQFDAFDLPYGQAHWNLSRLYETGEIEFVPEPVTAGLLAAGAVGLMGYIRRRRA